MSVEHVLKNIYIYYVSLLVLLANGFLNSLNLDISFIVPVRTPRRNDLVVKTPKEFLRFLHFFCNRLTSGLFIIIFSSSFLLPVV